MHRPHWTGCQALKRSEPSLEFPSGSECPWEPLRVRIAALRLRSHGAKHVDFTLPQTQSFRMAGPFQSYKVRSLPAAAPRHLGPPVSLVTLLLFFLHHPEASHYTTWACPAPLCISSSRASPLTSQAPATPSPRVSLGLSSTNTHCEQQGCGPRSPSPLTQVALAPQVQVTAQRPMQHFT